MSHMERHGPQGLLFCGKCWQYRDRETALACLDRGLCQSPTYAGHHDELHSAKKNNGLTRL